MDVIWSNRGAKDGQEILSDSRTMKSACAWWPELATELANATSVMQSLHRVHVGNVVHARGDTEARGAQGR